MMRSRQHVNPLGLGFETFRGRRPRVPDGVPVECEVGCADAQFLFERAAAAPERRYVGVEIREHLVEAVNDRARSEAAPIEAVFCNANLHLDKLFPPRRLAAVHLNFPDPWFKRRHHKRRMIDPRLAAHIGELLEPGGTLFVQTDVWDVALDALALFETLGWAENRAGEWTFWKRGNPFGARSWREANCEAQGLPIWRLIYRKR
jgi:tRNA (guanine-N7-)-methyltransferase